jgi:hypothetical protein
MQQKEEEEEEEEARSVSILRGTRAQKYSILCPEIVIQSQATCF